MQNATDKLLELLIYIFFEHLREELREYTKWSISASPKEAVAMDQETISDLRFCSSVTDYY